MGHRRHRVAAVATAAAVALVATGCIKWDEPASTPLALPAGSSVYPSTLFSGDIDGDGFDDLVGYATNGSDRTGFVLWSGGDGTFTQQDLPAARWPLTVADFDGDGIDDVVLGGPGNPYTGTSLPSTLYFGGPADGDRPRGLAPGDTAVLPDANDYGFGDFDGDGHQDLLRKEIIYTYYENYTPLLNDGSAVFTAAPELGAFSGPMNAGGRGYVKYHRNGRDIVRGKVLFETEPLPWDGVVGQPFTSGDIDGDGADDWAAIEGGKLVFYRWNGTTNVPFPPYQQLPLTGSVAYVELRDLDGDGIVDLFFADAAGPQYYSGTADGGFPYTSIGDFAPGTGPVFADVDDDGLADVVTVTADRRGIEVHRNLSTPVGS